MTVSQAEAATALQEIDAASVRSRQLYSYQIASAYLLLWGVLWIIAGVCSDISPPNTGTAWLIADAIGIPTSIWIGHNHARAAASVAAARGWTLRSIALIAVIIVFFAATIWIFKPRGGVQVTAYFALFTGSLYAGVGLWAGARYVVIGVALGVAVTVIYGLQLPHAMALVSAASGGAMILGGLWMRRA